MPKLRVTGRKAAFVGVSAAAATAALVAVAGPALAAPSQLTSCTDTVRVRSQPSQSAPVIGSCQAGERVTVDETRNGFAHLVNKQGWASLDFVELSESEDDEDSDNYRNDDESDSYDDDDNDSDNYDDDDDNGDDGLLGGFGN